ncbi:tyrosine-type recombinase/integrase [Bacillus halotolerans]|uniref:tyrosine-type recombinase/integrase n=1 Tax=Bacillus halotolerans TaxID=260554 RepID=UPI0025728876|nr:tyrosine-type recombinase/integrase [Bacillus halotolerans]MDL5613096.1 tyrosine-type recombinase/integrase [Bacillus halotolerans]
MKLYKSKKDNELFYYFNAKKEKHWCYRHRYYDKNNKRKEKSRQGFKTENEAYRALLEVKTGIISGETKKVENSNLTVAEWLDTWFDSYKNQWKITTQLQRQNAIKYQMKSLLGRYKLADLDKSTYKRVYINELLKRYKPSTVLLFHRLFKVAINAAVDDEILTRNRFNKITIESDEVSDNFYTAAELKQFLSAAKQYENITNYTLIFLLSYTGMRKGEALGLKWEDLDFDNKTLTVNRTRDNKGVRSPKTKRSYRTILIAEELIEQLKLYRKWCKEIKFTYGLYLSDEDFIFISFQSGLPVTDNTIMYSMRRLSKKTGLKKITPHGLRHSHATILISKRTPVKVIADRLGNTPQMILDIYGHSFKDLEEQSVLAFDQALNF